MSDTITVTGNIATEPELKRTPSGVLITTFRVASSERRYDKATDSWVDGHTNFYSVSTFRGLAEHVHASLHKGNRVILRGRLRMRAWETVAKKGLTAEIDADSIGPDLLWGTTTFHRDERLPRAVVSIGGAGTNNGGDGWAPAPLGDLAGLAAGEWQVASGDDGDEFEQTPQTADAAAPF